MSSYAFSYELCVIRDIIIIQLENISDFKFRFKYPNREQFQVTTIKTDL